MQVPSSDLCVPAGHVEPPTATAVEQENGVWVGEEGSPKTIPKICPKKPRSSPRLSEEVYVPESVYVVVCDGVTPSEPDRPTGPTLEIVMLEGGIDEAPACKSETLHESVELCPALIEIGFAEIVQLEFVVGFEQVLCG